MDSALELMVGDSRVVLGGELVSGKDVILRFVSGDVVIRFVVEFIGITPLAVGSRCKSRRWLVTG